MARQRPANTFLRSPLARKRLRRHRVSPHSTVPLPQDDEHAGSKLVQDTGEMTQHLLATGAPPRHRIDARVPARPSPSRKTNSPTRRSFPATFSEAVTSPKSPRPPHRIYGNLPYYITSPILITCSTSPISIDEIHSSFRRKVALRIAASPHARLRYLSVAAQFYTRPEFVFEIRAKLSIAAEVTSALVTLRLPATRKSSPSLQRSTGRRGARQTRPAMPFSLPGFVKLCFSQSARRWSINLRALAKSIASARPWPH